MHRTKYIKNFSQSEWYKIHTNFYFILSTIYFSIQDPYCERHVHLYENVTVISMKQRKTTSNSSL